MARKKAAADIDFEPISPEAFQLLTAPLRAYFSPVYSGLENIDPKKPCLLVGNHTLYGGWDWPIYAADIYAERGVLVRSLTDRAHFLIPIWPRYLKRFGNVEGTPENCAALMKSRQHVLVFPGGAREICKRHGEQYTLTWKERVGFARMAIEHGYPILPFASVGADDAYSILFDANDILRSPLGWLLKQSGIVDGFLRHGDFIPPISRGLGLTILPRPERFYLRFGTPISTRPWRGRQRDPKALWALREKVQEAIEDMLGALLLERERDESTGLLRRILTRL